MLCVTMWPSCSTFPHFFFQNPTMKPLMKVKVEMEICWHEVRICECMLYNPKPNTFFFWKIHLCIILIVGEIICSYYSISHLKMSFCVKRSTHWLRIREKKLSWRKNLKYELWKKIFWENFVNCSNTWTKLLNARGSKLWFNIWP